MIDGNQGPAWWFAWLGHTDTNTGMLPFLAVIAVYILICGTIAWMIS